MSEHVIPEEHVVSPKVYFGIFAALMVLFVPGLLAFCFGWLAFRSRVTGVYLSIITQAMTYALLLAFFRNDFGFGGNNGLTDFKDILGFRASTQTNRDQIQSREDKNRELMKEVRENERFIARFKGN